MKANALLNSGLAEWPTTVESQVLEGCDSNGYISHVYYLNGPARYGANFSVMVLISYNRYQ